MSTPINLSPSEEHHLEGGKIVYSHIQELHHYWWSPSLEDSKLSQQNYDVNFCRLLSGQTVQYNFATDMPDHETGHTDLTYVGVGYWVGRIDIRSEMYGQLVKRPI